MESLFDRAAACIAACDVDDKQRLSHETAARWRAGELSLDCDAPPAPIAEPGRPPRPLLVTPRDVPRRKLTTAEGRAALIHAVTHIEFNAINLAWDAVYRFRGMPPQYYADWVRVADEETQHFGMLRERLQRLGYDYGDFPAHNGLWLMARQTADDVLVRMALVPRVLEARGLDVTPGMIQRLRDVGDHETVAALEIILRDEIGHVAIGSHWFRELCMQRGWAPEPTFRELVARHLRGGIRGPLHRAARLQAGFSEAELARLIDEDAATRAAR